MRKDQDLSELAEKLAEAAGANLISLILYGSAATDEFHEGHSDLNLLAVVRSLTREDLANLHDATAWWVKKGHPAPLYLTLDELQHSADIFAIEFLDIKAAHRLLRGKDVMADLPIPMDRHRLQVERELRNNTLRLRQNYLRHPNDPKKTLELMTSSISSFTALFRHALLALGDEAPGGKRESVQKLASALGFDGVPFQAILDIREGRKREADLDVQSTFASYLTAIAKVTDEVDRRLTHVRGDR